MHIVYAKKIIKLLTGTQRKGFGLTKLSFICLFLIRHLMHAYIC